MTEYKIKDAENSFHAQNIAAFSLIIGREDGKLVSHATIPDLNTVFWMSRGKIATNTKDEEWLQFVRKLPTKSLDKEAS